VGFDGLLIIDKPAGPTSHDVVARVRRLLGVRRVGHTGTLDPLATGVLPLVVGRATRLARYLSASDKTYEATVRLGFATDTGDAAGQPIASPPYAGLLPDRDTIDRALDPFRGTFMQQPPAFSAKKIGGTRSYKLARRTLRANSAARNAPPAVDPQLSASSAQLPAARNMRSAPGPERSVFPAPSAIPAAARVTTYAIEIVRCEDAMITLRVHCTAGFYVRALAHDLGERLEVGAHLAALRRTRSGDITLDDAVALEELEDAGFGHARAIRAMIPLARMLPAIPACLLTLDGARRAIHGRDLGPADFVEGSAGAEFSGRASTTASGHFRLIDPDGTLVGVAEASAATGLLHPAVILV
jgi:tRNA pseudouridine55 synthase